MAVKAINRILVVVAVAALMVMAGDTTKKEGDISTAMVSQKPTGSSTKAVPICSNTHIIRLIGIPGATKPLSGLKKKTNLFSFRSATQPATGVMSWSMKALKTNRSPR